MKEFEILDWDSAFFGYPVARMRDIKTKWNETLNNLRSKGVKLAYWQVGKDNRSFSIFAKSNNGILVDIKTTYSINCFANDLVMPDQIELYKETEPETNILDLAVQCGIFSRFKVDPKITNEKFEKLYRLWMVQSIRKEMADDVLVFKLDNRTVGIVTVYLKNGVGNIGLIGVDKRFRGQGIGKVLINAAKAYFSMKGVVQINVVTQGMNKQACAMYERTGFFIREQSDFYHFWLK